MKNKNENRIIEKVWREKKAREKTKSAFCNHKFVYSHQESEEDMSTTSQILETIDVVICEKCGMVLRYKTL